VNETNLGDIDAKANHILHTTRIHATQPALDFLAKQYEPYQMDWHLLQSQESLPCGGRLTSFSVGNQDEVGFRLDWPGHSLAYVTDTIAKPDAPYVENIRGVNVLLHECNGPNRLAKLMVNIHHSYTLAVTQVAALAQVGRLILVHKNPIEQWSIDEDLEAGRAIFPSTEIGMDGMEIEF